MSGTIDLTNAKPCPDCWRMLTTEPKCCHCAERAALRAAAEIIRASGWRPIAEAPELVDLLVGGWVGDEWDTDLQWKHSAIDCGYTYYLPLPEPPAREESKSKNGEENDRQTKDNKCIG